MQLSANSLKSLKFPRERHKSNNYLQVIGKRLRRPMKIMKNYVWEEIHSSNSLRGKHNATVKEVKFTTPGRISSINCMIYSKSSMKTKMALVKKISGPVRSTLWLNLSR